VTSRGRPEPAPALVYGRNAVLEAARAGRLRRAYVAGGLAPDARLEELARLVQVERVSPDRLRELAGGVTHQGVAGHLAPRSFLTLRELLEPGPTLLLALDSIQDPQNLGAILRSAEAAGVEGVILPERRTAPISPAAVKASSGASELVTLCRVPGLPSALAEVKRRGLWCVALDPGGELYPWEFDLREPVCLVVGGEPGLHRLARDRCDVSVRLPMAGRIASLNASAAASALLYEVRRQRHTMAGS
jgi:23S rRNA (guanosine2251-2'-O)-methyltransferase